MRKFVSLFEIEKGLKVIWDLASPLDVNRLSNNTFMFSLGDKKTCDRIMANQHWIFRGSLLLIDRIYGEECPTDLVMNEAPFWIQIHGLQIRAMNRDIGEVIGSTLGKVLEIRCDTDGGAIGHYICIRALTDVHKPLVRWTNASIEGSLCRLFFHYEKFADFSFYCGCLDHIDKDCKESHLRGKKHYGPWLRAHGQHPVSL